MQSTTTDSNQLQYSWILPIKDEADGLKQLLAEIKRVMKGKRYEILAINDGSTDQSKEVLDKAALSIKNLKIVTFNVGLGKWAALEKGFSLAKGEIIITSDSDLQDDPRELPKLLRRLDQGADLVSGWRVKRQDPFYKVVMSQLGNKLASKLMNRSFHDLNSPFKVYRKEVIIDLPKQGSLLRFSCLFADKLGYKVVEVPITHRPRLYGRSKFGVIKYLRILYELVLVRLLFSGSGRLTKIK